jgi:pimeloyl-ACP methyl ester carboxylesterase
VDEEETMIERCDVSEAKGMHEADRRRSIARGIPFLTMLLVATTSAAAGSDPNDGKTLPRFEPAACASVAPFATKGFPTPAKLAESRCGYLFVPENRTKADSRAIRLAVIIVPSETQPAAADPVVHLAGGPGGSSMIELESLIAAGHNRKRDLILMSQRGTLFAEPELTCSVLDDYYTRSLDSPLDSDANHAAQLAASQACQRELAARSPSIDFAAYDTVENAADFADLRRALGIAEWNVHAVSYGTYLGQTLMFQHPEGIRTMTLDSVEPLIEADMASTAARNAREGFDNIFAACAAQPACAARYPDLAATFTRLVSQLEAAPVTTSVQLAPESPPVRVVLDGGAIVNGVIDTSFRTAEFANVPAWIDQLAHGHAESFGKARAIPALIPPSILAYGMIGPVLCSGYFADDSASAVLAAGRRAFPAYPDSVLAPGLHFTDALADCAVWNVPRTPKDLRTPKPSAIPTLVVSGTFDLVTPPSTGATAARPLSRATVLVFAGVGHAVVQSAPCAQRVFASFLDQPDAPDVGCVAELRPPTFTTAD